MKDKVISIKPFLRLRDYKDAERTYRLQIESMDKPTLLVEFLRYHEDYKKDPHDIGVTLRGRHLLEVLESRAELTELKELAQEFSRKLRLRLYEQIQGISK